MNQAGDVRLSGPLWQGLQAGARTEAATLLRSSGWRPGVRVSAGVVFSEVLREDQFPACRPASGGLLACSRSSSCQSTAHLSSSSQNVPRVCAQPPFHKDKGPIR